MNKTILAVAVAAFGLVAVPTLSQAADPGFFLNGAIGRSTYDQHVFDDDDTGYKANLGYRWAVAPNALIGIEGGYTDMGKFTSDPLMTADGGTTTARARIKGWTLGANGHFNITPEWYIGTRLGWTRSSLSGRIEGAPSDDWDVIRDNLKSDGWYAGVGFGYDFASNMSIGLDYDRYEAKKHGFKGTTDLVSISAEVRF